MTSANAESVPASPVARFVPVVCLLVVGSFIGITANLVKLAVGVGAGPVAFLAWSVLGAGLILLISAVSSGNRPALNRRTVEYFLMSGLLSVALSNALVFAAVPHVGAGFVALSFAFPPLYTYAMALAGGMERVRLVRAVGVLSGIAGAVVLAWSKASEPEADLLWIGVALSAPIIIAAGNIYRTLRWPAGASSMSLAPGMLLAAAMLLFIGAPVIGIDVAIPVHDGYSAVLLAAQTLTFAAMYMLYFVLQRLAGPVYLSQIVAVGAAAGAGIASLLLGETLPAGIGWAGALIALGVFLVSRSNARSAR